MYFVCKKMCLVILLQLLTSILWPVEGPLSRCYYHNEILLEFLVSKMNICVLRNLVLRGSSVGGRGGVLRTQSGLSNVINIFQALCDALNPSLCMRFTVRQHSTACLDIFRLSVFKKIYSWYLYISRKRDQMLFHIYS